MAVTVVADVLQAVALLVVKLVADVLIIVEHPVLDVLDVLTVHHAIPHVQMAA